MLSSYTQDHVETQKTIVFIRADGTITECSEDFAVEMHIKNKKGLESTNIMMLSKEFEKVIAAFTYFARIKMKLSKGLLDPQKKINKSFLDRALPIKKPLDRPSWFNNPNWHLRRCYS